MAKWKLPDGRKPLTATENAGLVKKMHDKLAAGFTAGDRIEQLQELYEAAKQDAKEAEAYAEELEAKLTRAVEALRFYAEGQWHEDYPGGVLYASGDDTCEFKTHLDYGDYARTTLAELKGETYE